MKNKKTIICLLLVVGTVLVGLFVYAKLRMTIEKVEKEAISLTYEPNLTMKNLKQRGYIDVTDTLDSENDKIEYFLDKAQMGGYAILRVAKISEGNLCAKILFYDKDYRVIRMWTVFPNLGTANDPGKCFNPKPILATQNGITTVTLENVQDLSVGVKQILTNEVLYSYEEKN